MAAGRPLLVAPRTFDDAKLASMVEPLSLRIDRLKDNKRSPIPIWDSNSGGTAGAGFTKEEIREVDTHLVTQWAGGGFYEIAVTDSSESPLVMRWQPFWSPLDYPMLVPPPLQGTISPDGPSNNPAPNPQGARVPPPFSFQPNQYPAPYQMPPAPAVGTQQYDRWRDEQERRESAAEVKRLREEGERRDREAREAAHKLEIERERTANNDRFSRLEGLISNLATGMKDSTPKGPSASELAMQKQLDEMREQTRRAEDRAETQRRELEADRREQLMRDQMRQQADEAKRAYETTQRQLETMNQQFQTTISNMTTQMANASNKSDPFITMMQEQVRSNADVLKTMAQESRVQMESLKAFMLNPTQMLALARDSQSGIEAAIERTTRFTDGVVTMQQRVLENAIQMQPQGSGVIDAVTQGMSNVKEFLERFVVSKAKTEQAQAAERATIAQAQAHAFEVQARASNPAAFAQPAALAGPSMPEPVAAPVSTPIPQPPVPADPQRLWGRTDREWFGPALPDVMQLRQGVAEFIVTATAMLNSGKMPEKIEDVPGAHPGDAAKGILVGAAMAQQQGVAVPAMNELLAPGLLSEFVLVLLPDATSEYRAAVVQALQDPKATLGGNDDEDDDSDDDEDDEPDVKPAAVTPIAEAKVSKNGARHQRRS